MMTRIENIPYIIYIKLYILDLITKKFIVYVWHIYVAYINIYF